MLGESSSVAAHCSPARAGVALALLCCIVLVAITFDADKIEALLLWVQENKREGAALFFSLYTAGVVLMLPAMVMAMAAGAVFGVVAGGILAWVGSSVGQVIAFLLGRYLMRGLVLGYLTAQFPKWTAVDRAMVTDGWKIVTLLRLSPIAPWNILNYALSVTSVPLTAYAAASSAAILPYLLLFVYFGSMARSLADIFTGAAGLGGPTTVAMGGASCAAMVALVWYTTHISRAAVNNALRQHAEELPPEITGDEDVRELLGGAPEMAAASGGGGGGDGGNSGGAEIAMTEIGAGGGSGEVTAGGITPRGRQRSSAAQLAAAMAAEDGERASLLVGKAPRGNESQGGLHVRSAHGSPRAASSPRSGAGRWGFGRA